MIKQRVFTVVVIAFLLSACSGGAGEAGNPAVLAAEAYARQDYFAARDRALEALRSDPQDATALDLLARVQLAMGQGDNALATLDRLAASGTPAQPEDAALLRAEAHLQRGNIDQARTLLDGQETAEAWRLRALIALQDGDAEAAAQAFARGRTAPGERLKLFAAEASCLRQCPVMGSQPD